MTTLKVNDVVRWKSHGSVATGRILKVIKGETHAGGRDVKASPDEPQYLVRSDASGGEAVHKATALERIPEKDRKKE